MLSFRETKVENRWARGFLGRGGPIISASPRILLLKIILAGRSAFIRYTCYFQSRLQVMYPVKERSVLISVALRSILSVFGFSSIRPRFLLYSHFAVYARIFVSSNQSFRHPHSCCFGDLSKYFIKQIAKTAYLCTKTSEGHDL